MSASTAAIPTTNTNGNHQDVRRRTIVVAATAEHLRISGARQERARKDSAICVPEKLFSLILAIVLIGLLIRVWKNCDLSITALDMESRLSKVESKLLQAQLDILDKKKKGLDGTDDDISLDDIRLFVKKMVEIEVARHAADGLGMVDYALGSGGGKVVKHSEPFEKDKSFLPRRSGGGAAQKMLEPSFGQPGECFALEGSSGFVVIKLRTGIIPEAVTLEHVDKSVAYDRSSAPKDFQVSGWYQGEVMTKLGGFFYDLEKNNAQTFQLDRTADSRVVNMIRLDLSSNHGKSEMTCIYRFRVHGSEPGSIGTTA